jgi:2-aminophenol/2-amino-5-chlorophenol 1,6-dioxygenase alpha subunit
VARGEVVGAYLVPGLAPLAVGPEAGPWAELRRARRAAAARIDRLRPDVLVVWSSQWISVLGHLYQALPNPKGVHVDENWHAMGDLPFDVQVDVELVRAAVAATETRGLQARGVAYEGFPLDTGTLVAERFLNAAARPLACVSCNIYAGAEEERTLGAAAAEAVASLGRRAVAAACRASPATSRPATSSPAKTVSPPRTRRGTGACSMRLPRARTVVRKRWRPSSPARPAPT